MTNYISSIKGLENLPKCDVKDKLFLIIHEGDLTALTVDLFEKILELKESIGQLELAKYTVQSERDLAIVAPIFKDEKSEFVLVDSDFPEFYYFGSRVTKLKTGKKKTSKKAEKDEKQQKNDEPDILNRIKKDANKTISPGLPPLESISPDILKGERNPNISVTYDLDKEANENNQVEQVVSKGTSDHDRVQLAKQMKKLLHLNPKEYNFDMGEEVFYLMIAQVYQKAKTDEEAKQKILALEFGEKLWEAIEQHVESIKNLI